jgi:hypothetical protein
VINPYNAPAHAAKATKINPGITRTANESPTLVAARLILLIAFVEKALLQLRKRVLAHLATSLKDLSHHSR